MLADNIALHVLSTLTPSPPNPNSVLILEHKGNLAILQQTLGTLSITQRLLPRPMSSGTCLPPALISHHSPTYLILSQPRCLPTVPQTWRAHFVSGDLYLHFLSPLLVVLFLPESFPDSFLGSYALEEGSSPSSPDSLSSYFALFLAE